MKKIGKYIIIIDDSMCNIHTSSVTLRFENSLLSKYLEEARTEEDLRNVLELYRASLQDTCRTIESMLNK